MKTIVAGLPYSLYGHDGYPLDIGKKTSPGHTDIHQVSVGCPYIRLALWTCGYLLDIPYISIYPWRSTGDMDIYWKSHIYPYIHGDAQDMWISTGHRMAICAAWERSYLIQIFQYRVLSIPHIELFYCM